MLGTTADPIVTVTHICHDFQQCRFPGTIDPKQADTIPGMNLNGQILKKVFIAVTDIQMIKR
jgi:hypothetical protein